MNSVLRVISIVKFLSVWAVNADHNLCCLLNKMFHKTKEKFLVHDDDHEVQLCSNNSKQPNEN